MGSTEIRVHLAVLFSLIVLFCISRTYKVQKQTEGGDIYCAIALAAITYLGWHAKYSGINFFDSLNVSAVIIFYSSWVAPICGLLFFLVAIASALNKIIKRVY
jgi:hypothetical protein